jgi:hypothetical protein
VTVLLAASTSKNYSVARNLIPSDKSIRTVKPGDERKRLRDGDGLYLPCSSRAAPMDGASTTP